MSGKDKLLENSIVESTMPNKTKQDNPNDIDEKFQNLFEELFPDGFTAFAALFNVPPCHLDDSATRRQGYSSDEK